MKKEFVVLLFCASCVTGGAIAAHQDLPKKVNRACLGLPHMAVRMVLGIIKADTDTDSPDEDNVFPKRPPVAPKPTYQDPDEIQPYDRFSNKI